MSLQEGRNRDLTVLAPVLGFSLFTKIGLALFVWSRNRTEIWHPDSSSYHSLALNILNHGVFSRASGPPFVYESFRTPGYPLMLSAMYALFGTSVLPVIVLQVVMATGSVALTWLLGRKLFASRAGAWAAVLLSLDLASVCSCQTLTSETAFTLFMLAAIWLLVRSLSPLCGWPGFVLSGFALASATYVRPVAYYLVPLGAIGLVVYFALKDRAAIPTGARWRLALTRAGAFLLAPVLLVGGWQLKNLQKTGNARFSHVECQNMYFYRAAGAISMRDHKPLFQVHREMGLKTERTDFSGWLAAHPEFAARNHAAIAEQWLRDGMAIIARNPGWYTLVLLRGTAALLLDPGTFCLATLAGLETDQRWQDLSARLQTAPVSFIAAVWSGHRFLFLSSLSGLAFLAVLYTGVVLWLVRARRSDWTPGVVIAVVVLAYFIIISAGPEAASRFRVPMAPLLAFLSAAGWLRLRRSRS